MIKLRINEASNENVYVYTGGKVPGDVKNVIVQDGVKKIDEDAFYDCKDLKSIKIPNSVTSIGDAAFYRCRSLTSITIPDSVKSIGTHAFYGCRSLTSITIPNGVTSIGWSTFYGCLSLTSVTIPNSITSIDTFAFENCESLKSIKIPNSVTRIGDDAFNGCPLDNTTLEKIQSIQNKNKDKKRKSNKKTQNRKTQNKQYKYCQLRTEEYYGPEYDLTEEQMSEFVDAWYKKLVDTKNNFPYNEVELWGMDESAIEDAYDSGELNEDDYNSLLDGYPEFFAGEVLSELGLD